MGLKLVSVVTVLLGSGTPHDMDDVECMLVLDPHPQLLGQAMGGQEFKFRLLVQLAELKWH